MKLPFLLLACVLVAPLASAQKSTKETFQSGTHTVTYELFSSQPATSSTLILLPGTSGPEAPLYRSQAQWFANHGCTTLLLHYFDAADSRSPSPQTYQLWAEALARLVGIAAHLPAARPHPVFVVGYSLGASIALAAGSQRLPVQAIAEWYGSLPDTFFFRLGGMPPLLILHGALDTNIPVINAQQLIRLCGMRCFDCNSHIYADQSHGFAAAAIEDADERTLAFFIKHGTAVTTPAPGQ